LKEFGPQIGPQNSCSGVKVIISHTRKYLSISQQYLSYRYLAARCTISAVMTDSAMDWSDLASSDLPTLGTGIGVASPHRSLAQLQVAGQSLLRGGNDSAPFFVAPAAMKPGEPVATQNKESMYSSTLHTAGRPFESLEDLIRRQEQESLSKIIQRFHDETRKSTNEAIERQLQAAGWPALRWRERSGGPFPHYAQPIEHHNAICLPGGVTIPICAMAEFSAIHSCCTIRLFQTEPCARKGALESGARFH
jgi:hypothetical protein